MAAPENAGDTGNGPKDEAAVGFGDEELEQRRRRLATELATKRPAGGATEGAASRGRSSYGLALKLSSEFIGGVVVGGGLGWGLDRFAGTSPWGLIVLLLVGFAAGILNVLRSAGVVAASKLSGPGESRHGDKG